MTSTAPEKLTLDEALTSARETRALLVAPGALRETARIFSEQFPGRRALVIADAHTMPLAGRTVEQALAVAGIGLERALILDDPALYAELRFVEQVEAALRRHDAIPVAVGAGTVNDLVKLATHRTGREGYLCVATAASMDGYTAFGASITANGAKQTFDCPAPRAVVADLDLIRGAPAEMTAAGYADLFAKITAGADWILAEALGAEPIDARAWTIVQGGLRGALADPAGARAGEPRAMTLLVEGLMLGGFAMQWTKSSRPASGAEHQFSHLWDMEHHTHRGEAPAHGFKVGLATLAVTSLYEWLLAQPFDQLDIERCVEGWPTAAEADTATHRMFAGDDFLATALKETAAKHITRDDLRTQLGRLRSIWPATRARLAAQLLPLAEARRRLQAVGAPTEPEAIGLTRARLRASFLRAQHIRRRFTVLDLAVRTATLEPALEALFGAGGAWADPVSP
ncbi:MAG: sn-glycerol-1-phosphate dehydrogenase [Opitutaceae bacterium]|nr:sn-glycerol-1-phosphate dehydrogenase [Opitutaceae bacterium]